MGRKPPKHRHVHPVTRVRVRESPIGVRKDPKPSRYYFNDEPLTTHGERHYYGITSLRCIVHKRDVTDVERRGCGKVSAILYEIGNGHYAGFRAWLEASYPAVVDMELGQWPA